MIFSLSSKFTHKLSVIYGEKRNENLLDEYKNKLHKHLFGQFLHHKLIMPCGYIKILYWTCIRK